MMMERDLFNAEKRRKQEDAEEKKTYIFSAFPALSSSPR